MNFLILSAGRRTKLLEYFVNEFKGVGEIVSTDCDSLASALYFSDKGYIVPRINSDNYIDIIKKICLKENIKGLISLIDPELALISKHEDEFKNIGVTCFLSKYEVTELCFNKYNMFKFLDENNFNTAKSYIDFDEFKKDYKNKKINFPVFVKPVCGSASIDCKKVNTIGELEFLMNKYNNLIIQEFLDGKEIGVDVYIDVISGEVVSIFAKEKLRMRAGETDKSKSIKCNKLFLLIKELAEKLGAKGPIDIDVFKINDEYYISEVNPRFGGGYPHAYECGENFINLIKNNLFGIINKVDIGNYLEDIYAIKSDIVTIIDKNELIKFEGEI